MATIRTTAELVKGVLLSEYDSKRNPSLDPFMLIASKMVDRVAACAAEDDVPLDAEEKELLERLLAAHAYQSSDPGYSSRSTMGASGSFNQQTGMGLEGTRYGQLAMTADPSGCLALMNSKKRAEGFWLGKPTQDQLDYDQRNTRDGL